MVYEDYFANKRSDKRIPCSWTGNCTSSDEISHKIKCQDISPCGVGISSAVPLPPRMTTKLEIDTDKNDHFSLEGKVCWCRKDSGTWYAGIAFDKTFPLEMDKVI